MTVTTLSGIVQWNKESLQSYINWFTQVSIEVEGVEEGLKCQIFENGLLREYPFRLKIGMKKIQTIEEMLSMAQSYLILEEKLNTEFVNPTFVDTNSGHPFGKEFHYKNDDSKRGMQGQYDKYTLLNAYREKIYQDCAKKNSRREESDPLSLLENRPRITSRSIVAFIKSTTKHRQLYPVEGCH